MSFLLKNRETLTCLFKTFNLQEILQVNQNLKHVTLQQADKSQIKNHAPWRFRRSIGNFCSRVLGLTASRSEIPSEKP